MVTMSTQDDPAAPAPMAGHHPLREDDPPRIGDFWLDSRLTATPAGTAFGAHEAGGDSVLLIVLSAGAATDAAARARFSGEVNAMHIDTVVARGGEGQHEGRTAVRFRPEAGDPLLSQHAPLAPWVALAFDGSLAAVQEADRVLHAVDLSRTPPLSKPAGPDFRLHWISRSELGATRMWPLPWPGRTDRAGWITVLVSFLLMVLLTALALLLAILLFQNQPPVNAPQPIPSMAEGDEGTGSPQPEPPDGDVDASPTGTPGADPGPYTESPAMNQPNGPDSGPGQPSPNRRL